MYGNLYVLDDETGTYKLVSSLNITTSDGISPYLDTVLTRLEGINRNSSSGHTDGVEISQ